MSADDRARQLYPVTPGERLRSAYEATEPQRARAQQEMLAELFRPNERMEDLLRLRAEQPAIYATLGPAVRVAVGHYEQQKQAAEALKHG